MNRAARAVFLTTVLVVVGSNLGEVQVLLINYFRGEGLPDTRLFANVFSFVWIPAAAATAWCGIAGGYRAIRDGTLSSAYLTALGVLSCPVLKVDGRDLGAAAWRLSFAMGLDRFAVGLNVLGIAYLVWLSRLRAGERVAPPPSPHPTAGTDSTLV